MTDQEIKNVFADVAVPDPDETAKEAAISAAMAEFAKQNAPEAKKVKGFAKSYRLISTFRSKFNLFGESTMKRRYIWSGAVTACFIVVVFGVSKLMEESNRVTPADQFTTILQPSTQEMVKSEQKPSEKQALQTDAAEYISEIPTVTDLSLPPSPAPNAVPPTPQRVEAKRSQVGESKAPAEFSGQGSSPTMTQSMVNGKTMVMPIRERETDGLQAPAQPVEGRDKFTKVGVNPVKQVAEEPVSTFSIDVDTASYAFVRKMLNQGTLPPKHAVRVEELINYFDYDYALPINKNEPFLPTVAVYPTPWNPHTKLLHIGIRGYDLKPEKRPTINLVFLIDVSGSMNRPDKLPLLKNAFRMLVENLQETDTVSIVVYAGSAGTVLEPTKAKEKGKILSALDKLSAGGSTAGGEGIRQAYALAEANYEKTGVNRVILATDGDFNVGITNPEDLKGFVERKRKTGIFLSVIGFGQGNYHDTLMQKLAQNGNGNASYIDNLNEARKVLVQEANATLFAIARDVKIQIEFNPAKVAEYRLIGYETRMLKREDFNNDQVDAGEIGSGHRVTAIYEIAEPGSKGKLHDSLRYGRKKSVEQGNQATSREYAFLKIRYKTPSSNQSTLLNVPVGPKTEFKSLADVSQEIRFAAAVAAYGQLLRQDPYTKTFTYDDVIKLALPARGDDTFGLRNEFVNLVRLAKSAQELSH